MFLTRHPPRLSVNTRVVLFLFRLVPKNWYFRQKTKKQTKMKQAFATLDGNQDGQILMSELRALLGQMGEMPSERHLQVGAL